MPASAARATGQPFVAVYTDAKTRIFEKSLAWAGKAVMGARKPLSGPLAVAVDAVLTIPASWSARKRDDALRIPRPTGRPDVDNLAKTVDALNKLVWQDDSQIVDLRVTKRYGEDPMLRVEVRDLAVPLVDTVREIMHT